MVLEFHYLTHCEARLILTRCQIGQVVSHYPPLLR